tara:strand:+ start:169 stop:720 length:552 start_codon:yes stop_codon:yes gene_type:complete
MIKYLSVFLFLLIFNLANANDKNEIIKKLQKIENLSFNFEQNLNGKIEQGKCIIKYPKKIWCIYDKSNNKILVSNGNSLVIKTNIGSYYRYLLRDTPLNLILDKNFIINEIKNLKGNIINEKFISYTLTESQTKIDVFFNRKSLNIVGWQTLDIYQNTTITKIYNTLINQKIKGDIFKLPKLN